MDREAAAPTVGLADAGLADAGLADAGLVAAAVDAQVMENAARARRLLAIGEFHRRQVREAGQRCPVDPSFFRLTPMQSTTAEFSPALVVSDLTIEIAVGIVGALSAWFPNIWAQCLSGRLDLGRAQLLLDAANCLAREEDIARFAALMDEFLTRYDDPDSPICTVSYAALQRAARRRKLRFEQKSDQETFAQAYQRRRLSFRPGEDGMGTLVMRSMITDAMTADYRVTLIAKKLQDNPGETRTLEQLRADVAIGLLLGTLEVTATLTDLETDNDPDPSGNPDDPDNPDGPDGDGPDGRRNPGELVKHHPPGAFARPVVNVTVPIQTLIGLCEEPGLISGGNPIPAELARIIASDPGSTWYRMLTDPARRCAELSTTAYRPTPQIWRQVVASDQVCVWPTCSRPAVRVELDHEIEYPTGPTSTDNLGPKCRRHHKVKHAPGFTITRNPDGSCTWTTPTGSTYTNRPEEQPVAQWPDPETVSVGPSP